MPLQTKIQTITPEWAKQQLDKLEEQQLAGSFKQRGPRERAVHRYAQDMKAGKWLLTHQGIALDDKDRLIDGQNRLWAVVRSGCSVEMLVTTGVPPNGKLTAMDVIDGGAPRSMADAFKVSHGYEGNASELATLARQIVRMLVSASDKPKGAVIGQTVQVSVAEALFIIEDLNYAASFERLCAILPLRKMRRAPLVAPWCWYHTVYPRKAEKFITDYANLEDLKKGDPALALFRYFSGTASQRRVRLSLTEYQTITASALKAYDSGAQLINAAPSREAMRWLVQENQEHADKILKRVLY